MKTEHSLKILPSYFDLVVLRIKNFELRKDDRKYNIGDILVLKEYDGENYTGSFTKREIKYILRNCPEFGLKKGYVILGIS